jgi:hypothetical protein
MDKVQKMDTSNSAPSSKAFRDELVLHVLHESKIQCMQRNPLGFIVCIHLSVAIPGVEVGSCRM